MYIRRILAVASISVLLNACGGSSSDSGADVDTGADADTGTDADAGADGISQLGILSIDQFTTGQNDDIDIFIVGRFFNLDDSTDIDLDLDSQFDEVVDTCEIDGGEDGDLGLDLNPISAGETITVSSAAGTYATIVAMTIPDLSIVYGTQDELATPLPQNLIIDIPGDEFPAFANVSVPNAPPLDISPGSDDTITADTEFQWTPSSVAFSTVAIEATYTSANASVDILCVARDDGSFSYPTDIRDMIGSAQASFVILSRSTFDIVDSGDSRLIIVNGFEL